MRLVSLLLLGMLASGLWFSGFSTAQAVEAATCDLHQSECRAPLHTGEAFAVLSITPRPIKTMTRQEISVQLEGISLSALLIDFSGVEMFMGLNQTRLQADADGVLRGSIILPACMSAQMTWQVKLFSDTDKALLTAPFFFKTGR
ncbi:hypothetical protein [Thiorhodospira sibirica]|uniref:hypothetical protein n=1 Tax=Thiorhodospira sibirica TaxID=154347 RepID=UPI00022C1105|nr:hypothetical protein [Thiorhodospira sibirica]